LPGGCMRHLILVGCASVTLAGQAVAPPSRLDQPMGATVFVEGVDERNPCLLWTALEQLARHARVRIGFEQTLDCSPAPWVLRPDEGSLNLGGLTPRQAIDSMLARRPDYRWMEVDGVAVIRPVTAWTPAGSVLNAPVTAFAVTKTHPHLALHTVFQSSRPLLFLDHMDLRLSVNGRRGQDPGYQGLIDSPVSVRFDGGNLVQALNAITRGFSGIWQAGYVRRGDYRHSLSVALYTLELDGGITQLQSNAFITRTAR
jgi:hypothetical protein